MLKQVLLVIAVAAFVGACSEGEGEASSGTPPENTAGAWPVTVMAQVTKASEWKRVSAVTPISTTPPPRGTHTLMVVAAAVPQDLPLPPDDPPVFILKVCYDDGFQVCYKDQAGRCKLCIASRPGGLDPQLPDPGSYGRPVVNDNGRGFCLIATNECGDRECQLVKYMVPDDRLPLGDIDPCDRPKTAHYYCACDGQVVLTLVDEPNFIDFP